MSAVSVDVSSATGLVGGARTVSFAGVRAEIPDNAEGAPVVVVDDEALVAALGRSGEYAAWVESGGQTTLSAGFALRDPVEAVAVPPGALFALDGQRACVRSDGRDRAVTVVASRLGQSLVRADDSAPAVVDLAVVDRPPSDPSASCR